MKGVSFCTGARQTIGLLMKNLKQVAVVETITNFLFLIGKLVIVATSGLLAFAWFEKGAMYQEGEENELDSTLIPMAIVLIIALVVARTFLGVYHLTIQTILVCFCEDREKHSGKPEDPYFMSDRLKKIIGASLAVAVAEEGEEAGKYAAGEEPRDGTVTPVEPFSAQPGGYDAPSGGYNIDAAGGGGAGGGVGGYGGGAPAAPTVDPSGGYGAPAAPSVPAAGGGYGGVPGQPTALL
mmetsp:Transcript_12531/g.16941  ORF Transcript_12531/g.16941 Transcript_12531/m.16941 type:complete len:238 (+) Transcript_12531:1-714(+)